MTDEVPGITQEMRDVLRRVHMDEPIELTNVHGQAASHDVMNLQERFQEHMAMSQQEAELIVARAQINATLALAQEVKNLRLAMYPTSGEST